MVLSDGLYRPPKSCRTTPRWLFEPPHADETGLRCLLRVSQQPVNVTELNDVQPACAAALKHHCCAFTGHQWQISRQKLSFSFSDIILRDCASRFMPSHKFGESGPLLVSVFTRERKC